MSPRLRPRELALALVVVAIWGTNFVVIEAGLRELPPMTFVLLRFVFSAFPFLLFIARPRVPWRYLAAYGLLLGPGQFGLLFHAMREDITPGLASLVIQSQVFFTMAASMWLFRERLPLRAAAGALLGIAGLAVIGMHLDAGITARGLAGVLGAGACWGAANIVVKQASRTAASRVDPLAFVVWSSVFAIPPLLLLVAWMEGVTPASHALTSASLGAWAAVAWQVLGNTLFAFAAWGWLLTRYDAAAVAPYALLVPVFGMGASTLLLGEPMQAWKVLAAGMVLAGIGLGTLPGRRR